MLNGIWKGKKYVATDIEKDYNLEKLIRKASSNKELYCPDPDCKGIIKYCNGSKKDAYFSHLANNNCDYANFDSRNNTKETKLVRLALFEHFKKLGYNVEIEVKATKRRYAHLLFNMVDGTKIAIQVCTKNNYVNYMDSTTSDFSSSGIKICWIVINDTEEIFSENDTCYSERRMFYETNKQELIVISPNCIDILQCKMDTRVYEYDGKKVSFSHPYSEVFNYKGIVEDLDFVNNELTIVGFDEAYKEWMNEKKNLFDAKIKEISQREHTLSVKKTLKNNTKDKRKSFEEYTYEDFKKEKERVTRASKYSSKIRLRDRYDNIWLICKECNELKPLFEFEKINDEATKEYEKYNYPGNPQLRYCKKCLNK